MSSLEISVRELAIKSNLAVKEHVKRCLKTFARLLSNHNFDSYKKEIRLEHIQDELGRFLVWSDIYGAQRVGEQSLDYKLRDSSHIRGRVITLIKDLDEILQTIIAIFQGDKVQWDCQSESEFEPKNKLVDDTELKQLRTSMQETVSLLLRLAPVIVSPSRHDQLAEPQFSSTSTLQGSDIEHIHRVFPEIEIYLAIRLAAAISSRRRYFKYRESTMKSSVTCWTDEELRGRRTKHEDDVSVSDSSSRGSSFRSETGEKSPRRPNDRRMLHHAPYPRLAKTETYVRCPLCRLPISAPTERSWIRHMFKDLQPYVCTMKDCAFPDRLYSDKNHWFEHEKQAHFRRWRCTGDCVTSCKSKPAFEDHLRSQHKISDTSQQMALRVDTHERQPDLEEFRECLICRERLTLDQFRDHMAEHQQQLALIALPKNANYFLNENRIRIRTQDPIRDTSAAPPKPHVYPKVLNSPKSSQSPPTARDSSMRPPPASKIRGSQDGESIAHETSVGYRSRSGSRRRSSSRNRVFEGSKGFSASQQSKPSRSPSNSRPSSQKSQRSKSVDELKGYNL